MQLQKRKNKTPAQRTDSSDTDMDDGGLCAISVANLIHCDSESRSKGYFGKELLRNGVTVGVSECVSQAFEIHMIWTWMDQYIH